jgi:hypothetical protein
VTDLIDRSGCAGTRHGDRTAYKAHRCRCPDALADKRRSDKFYEAGIAVPHFVPLLGPMRRLQALAAIGWDTHRLAGMLGVDPTWLGKHRGGDRPYLTRPHAERIAALYDRLQGTPGPSARSRTYARKFGWAPPLAWEDGAIDDPKAGPVADDEVSRRGRGIDDDQVVEMHSFGRSEAEIGRTLGVTEKSIRRVLRRVRAPHVLEKVS